MNKPSQVMGEVCKLEKSYNHVIKEWTSGIFTDTKTLRKKLLSIRKKCIELERNERLLPTAWLKIIKIKYLTELTLFLNIDIDLDKELDFNEAILKW